MGIIQPDTSAAQEMSPIEPGTYPGRAVAVADGISKSGGAKVVVEVELTIDGKTRKRQAHLPVTGPGAGTFDKLLRACGFDELADKFKAGQSEPFDTDNLVGCEFQVVIAEDIYNGEKRDRISTFLKS